jgi:hypothetical protein
MNTIKDRLLLVIESELPDNRRFKSLEEATGIDADRWKAVWHDRQRPTAEMIESIAKKWPDCAFWLATGLTEPHAAHIAPIKYIPRHPIPRGKKIEQVTAERMYLLKLLSEQPKTAEEMEARSKALEEQALKIREAHAAPGIWLAFQKLQEKAGEPPTPEMLLLELDDELIARRADRMKALKELEHATEEPRKGIRALIPWEKGIALAKQTAPAQSAAKAVAALKKACTKIFNSARP